MIINGNEYIETIKTLMEEGKSVNVVSYSLYNVDEELFKLFKETKSRLIVSIPPYFACDDDGCEKCFEKYIDNIQNMFDILDEFEIDAKVVIKVHAKMFYSNIDGDNFVYSLGSKNLYNSQSKDFSFIKQCDSEDEDLRYLMNEFEQTWDEEQLMPFGKYSGEKISEILKDDDYFNSLYSIGLGNITTSSMPLVMYLKLRSKDGEKLYL